MHASPRSCTLTVGSTTQGLGSKHRASQGGQKPQAAFPDSCGWRQLEAGLRGPICRHSGLEGDSAFYLYGKFKSLFPPRAVGSLVPVLRGCPVTGQMGGTSSPSLRHSVPSTPHQRLQEASGPSPGHGAGKRHPAPSAALEIWQWGGGREGPSPGVGHSMVWAWPWPLHLGCVTSDTMLLPPSLSFQL